VVRAGRYVHADETVQRVLDQGALSEGLDVDNSVAASESPTTTVDHRDSATAENFSGTRQAISPSTATARTTASARRMRSASAQVVGDMDDVSCSRRFRRA